MSQSIVVVGAPQSGKTYLMTHLTRSYFEAFRTDKRYQPTIGIDLVGVNELNNIRYVYYDCSGQDRFLDITKPYFERCDAIMISFDLSRQDFQDLKKWYDLAKCVEKPTLIVGTKHDLIGEGSEQMLLAAVEFAQQRECPFYPTSSVSGMGIRELRNALQNLIPADEIIERSARKQKESRKRLKQNKRLLKFRGLFCCIGKGYRTLDDTETHQLHPDNLGVSV